MVVAGLVTRLVPIHCRHGRQEPGLLVETLFFEIHGFINCENDCGRAGYIMRIQQQRVISYLAISVLDGAPVNPWSPPSSAVLD